MYRVLLLAMVGIGGSALSASVARAQSVDQVPRTYASSDEDFPNPERGFMLFCKAADDKDFAWLRERGVTLAYWGVSLAAYRGAPIDAEFLAQLEEGFRKARVSGLKIVLRFHYCVKIGGPDAPKTWVLKHLEQLKPVLHANADVIAVVQAGFIGAWGEWHSSTNGLQDSEVRKEILEGLLAAVPASRVVQVRTPHFKVKALGAAPLAPAEAYKGTARSRVGHHNDAIFADADDMGTYQEPVKASKDWLAQDSRFVPVGGETAGPPRGSGAEFGAELERFHWSYLHWRYSDKVKKQWEQEGSLPEIRRRLGYRFTLVDASWPPSVRPGGEFRLEARLKNTGYAALFNKRPLVVVLSRGQQRLAAKIASVDPRQWAPGEESKIALKLALPASVEAGTWRLSLALPDDSPSLTSRPEYAVRFANDKMWDAESGVNVLGEVKVDASAPGSGDSRVKEFSEVP